MRSFLFLALILSLVSATGQNIRISGINKLYYYRTSDHFFSNKKDSIVAKDIVYDYGKISYTNPKTNKKIKFNLHKDSAFFAFRIAGNPANPVYAINEREKRYGVFMGGAPDLYCVFYSRGNLQFVTYDSKNYVTSYSGTIDEFGYYLVFSKKNYTSKKNGDIEYFIKDKEKLSQKYLNERANATTHYWNKYHIQKQVEYMRLYNE